MLEEVEELEVVEEEVVVVEEVAMVEAEVEVVEEATVEVVAGEAFLQVMVMGLLRVTLAVEAEEVVVEVEEVVVEEATMEELEGEVALQLVDMGLLVVEIMTMTMIMELNHLTGESEDLHQDRDLSLWFEGGERVRDCPQKFTMMSLVKIAL